jgi:alpha-1,2-mannosyltransferase
MANQLVSQAIPTILGRANSSLGFLATTATEFAEGFEQALSLEDKLAMRLRARQSAKRFTEEQFAKRWVSQMEILVKMRQMRSA